MIWIKNKWLRQNIHPRESGAVVRETFGWERVMLDVNNPKDICRLLPNVSMSYYFWVRR